MGKLVMDALTYGSFHQEVILKLPFLKNHVTSKSFYDKALYYANNINLSPEGRILDVLAVTQAEIISEYGKALPNVTPTIYYSNIMWEYVYILLYYAHYGEQLWIDTIMPKMWKMQKNAVIRDEMKKGEEYVDEYISARRDFNEKKRAASLQAETVPDVVQIMRDINAGKIRYIEVDWEQQIKAVLKLCKLMPTKFPYVIWLWGLLGEIEDPTIRMDIIDKMQSAAPKCFDDQFEAQRFIEECTCIYQICIRARAYNLRNDIGIRHKWTDERKSLNDLAHIFSDKVVEPSLMVALAEEMYSSVQDGEKKHYMLTLVLRAPRSIGKLTIDNIVDFAKNLYIAEGFRQLLIEGKEDSLDVPTLETFNWKLRNACFDVYINLRKALIKEELEQDNTRVDGASDVECLEYLLEEENAVVDCENGLEQFRGSAAYHAMWYPGRQIVLDMIKVFIKYLQTRIEKAKKDAAENEALAAISSNAAVAKMAAIVKQAISGQGEQHAQQELKEETTTEDGIENKKKTPTKEEIEEIFLPIYTRTANCQMLINLLLDDRDKVSDTDWARYALTIYRCKKIFRHHPESFKDWLPKFCSLLGRDVEYRAPSDLNRTKCKTDISSFLPKP